MGWHKRQREMGCVHPPGIMWCSWCGYADLRKTPRLTWRERMWWALYRLGDVWIEHVGFEPAALARLRDWCERGGE